MISLSPYPSASSAVLFGEERRHALDNIGVESDEATGRVPEAVVLPPASQVVVEISDDLVGEDMSASAPSQLPDTGAGHLGMTS